MRARNGAGTTDATGGWYSFATLALPGAFLKTGSIVTFGTCHIEVEREHGGRELRLLLRHDQQLDVRRRLDGVGTTRTCSSPAWPRTHYYWQIRAVNAAGTTYADGGRWVASRHTPILRGVRQDKPSGRLDGTRDKPDADVGHERRGHELRVLLRLGERRCLHAMDDVGTNTSVTLQRAEPMDVVLLAGARGERDGDDLRRPRIMVGLRRGARDRGRYHTCEVRGDGSCPVGVRTPRDRPRRPAGPSSRWMRATEHTCAVRTDGTVACWGCELHGQATPPAGTFRQVSAGSDVLVRPAKRRHAGLLGGDGGAADGPVHAAQRGVRARLRSPERRHDRLLGGQRLRAGDAAHGPVHRCERRLASHVRREG